MPITEMHKQVEEQVFELFTSSYLIMFCCFSKCNVNYLRRNTTVPTTNGLFFLPVFSNGFQYGSMKWRSALCVNKRKWENRSLHGKQGSYILCFFFSHFLILLCSPKTIMFTMEYLVFVCWNISKNKLKLFPILLRKDTWKTKKNFNRLFRDSTFVYPEAIEHPKLFDPRKDMEKCTHNKYLYMLGIWRGLKSHSNLKGICYVCMYVCIYYHHFINVETEPLEEAMTCTSSFNNKGHSQESNQASWWASVLLFHTWGFQGQIPLRLVSERSVKTCPLTLLALTSHFSLGFTNGQSKDSPWRPAKHRLVYFRVVKGLEPPS